MFYAMKDYSYLNDKPFCCDVDGCTMEFLNEYHFNAHKKKHDMTLSLGLVSKGATFNDQTPTPTQFIRNCEEVGLFQDLQNVNPFEETFRKAVESATSGQPFSLVHSQQSNPPDDTLHTPNIFPHITDIPSLIHSDSCLRTENISSCEDDLSKLHISESVKTSATEIQPDVKPQPENTFPLKNMGKTENKVVKGETVKLVLNVQDSHIVQVPPVNSRSFSNMVVTNIPEDSSFLSSSLIVKEKLKKSLTGRKTGKYLQQKVPILKCSAKKTSNSLSKNFSMFSKNALKIISKLENSSAESSLLNDVTPKRQRKSNKFQQKESRSDFLARNRAASYRCREKKKLYILYLEKVNNELSTANQSLNLMNNLLRREICDLYTELLKHQNCNAADKNTKVTISTISDFVGKITPLEMKKNSELLPPLEQFQTVKTNQHSIDPQITFYDKEEISSNYKCDPNSFSIDVAEVILDDDIKDNEIPLSESNRPPDIIVRFNSIGNDLPSNLLPDLHLSKFIEGAGEDVKQIYSEHSYYFKKPTDVYKRIINYKTFSETIGTVSSNLSEDCKDFESLNLEKSDAFRDASSLNTKVLLEPRTPPPLHLLKPFKKRSIQNKNSGKT